MSKKINEDNGFLKREESERTEIEVNHQFQHSKEFANDWMQTPEWAVNYKTPSVPVSELISLAKKMERLQQIKEKNFGDELSKLGEPAWKILLQLVIVSEKQKNITLAEITRRISLPDIIAVRYIDILVNTGYIAWSEHSPNDVNDRLRLTSKGQSIMRKTLLQLDTI